MQELEKILEEMRQIKDGNRKENLYAKYPPNGKDQEVLNAYSQGYEDGTDNFYNAVVYIIRKYMENDGWISVNSYGLPSSSEHDFRFWVTVRYKNGFRRTLKATWNYFDNHFVYQNGKMILEDVVAYRYYSAPDPYRPERSDNHDGE